MPENEGNRPPPLPTGPAPLPYATPDTKPKKQLMSVGWVLLIVLASCILLGYLVPTTKTRPAPVPTPNAASKIPPGFDPWDGSNIAVVKAVKQRLDDPASFEHVETRFWDTNGGLTVTMKYRARNALGAKTLQQVTADCRKADGSLIELLQ